MPTGKARNSSAKSFAESGKNHQLYLESPFSEKSASSLEDFNRLVASWQSIVETELQSGIEKTSQEDRLITRIEGTANKVLLAFARQGNASQFNEIDPVYENFNYSVFLLDHQANIQAFNSHARNCFDAGERDSLNNLPIAPDGGENLVTIAKRIISSKNDLESVIFTQAYDTLDDRNLTLAIIQSRAPDNIQPGALLMIIDTTWNDMAGELIATNFRLTEAEVQVLQSFVKGKTLKQISQDRARSYVTIRNQFQSLLDKTGSTSQTELLRLFLNISFLTTEIKSLQKKKPDPYIKSIEIMRPNGRYVDVLLYGDLQGKPVISLPSLFGHPTTPDINRQLATEGWLFIGIQRPGFGKTSPPSEPQDLYKCLASDISAVLDALEVEKCAFIGRASAARSMFNLVHLVPERIEKAIMVNSLVPRPYIREKSITSKWTISLLSATRFSPTIATLILGSGSKLMKTIGAKRFIKNMYERSQVDQEAVEDPEVTESIRKGVEIVTSQGLQAGTKDMLDGFQDWSGEVASAKIPVVLIQGHDDPHIPIEASRAFAAAFPQQVKLVEVKEGGGLLNYTSLEVILSELKSSYTKVS